VDGTCALLDPQVARELRIVAAQMSVIVLDIRVAPRGD